MIITISREFGSGGREIGKRLADELNMAYYDDKIINMLVEETGMSEEYIQNISEQRIYPYTFQFAKTFNSFSTIKDEQTEILVKQSKIIKKIAEKGNCIIVGRGANVILKAYNTIDLFIYANMETKIKRCKEKADKTENLTDKEIEKLIIKISKERQKFHNIISSEEWGKKENYDLCINTSGIEIKKIIPSLANYIKNWFEK